MATPHHDASEEEEMRHAHALSPLIAASILAALQATPVASSQSDFEPAEVFLNDGSIRTIEFGQPSEVSLPPPEPFSLDSMVLGCGQGRTVLPSKVIEIPLSGLPSNSPFARGIVSMASDAAGRLWVRSERTLV